MRSVKKRDGSLVEFDERKIANAIFKAVLAVGGTSRAKSDEEAKQVTSELDREFFSKGLVPSVEQIQDSVEKILIHNGHAKTAKAYILYRQERNELRKQKVALFGKDFKTGLSLNALKVIAKRYAVRDAEGNIIETPEEMFRRVALALAEVERDYGKGETEIAMWADKFHSVMASGEFLPGGRTLANAGGPTPLVSNCIVLHMDDTMDGIFSTLKDAALLQQAGSGLGFPFHLLRPAGTMTVRSRGSASGPVSFLNVYNQAFGVIKQQGRHGANMAIMRVDHPDILDFIHCKAVEGEIRNFNISVALTDEFMKQVSEGSESPWMCEFRGKRMYPRRITRDSGSISAIKEEIITARDLMDEIVMAAWNNGEPGIVFIDAVNSKNPLPELGRIEACNPCGEQFLHDGDVCNLGSINLEKFATLDGKVDYDKLRDVTETAVRLLDNVVDRTNFPVDRVNRTFKGNRRIGLGIMGFADLLYLLGVRYNSKEGFETAEKVMRFINETAHNYSVKIAEEKGVFPNHSKSVHAKAGRKMRNAALTTIAPTGSISMILDVASGLEPYFALAYEKSNIMGGQSLSYTNRHLERVLKQRDLYNEELMLRIAKTGSVQGVEGIPADIQNTFVTAMDIPAEDHIRMQAAFQRHVDNSISKTINFPFSATKEDVMAGYVLAWRLGCKGCTVYRNDSRKVQILNLVKQKDGTESAPAKKKVEPASDPEAPLEGHGPAKRIDLSTFIPSKSALSKLDFCPSCESKSVQYEEGCFACKECGYSACSL